MKLVSVFVFLILVVCTHGVMAEGMKCGSGGGGHHGMAGHGMKSHGIKSIIQYADANDDGDITYQEFQRAKYKFFNHKFSELDRDGNGVVSQREFMEYHRTKGDQMFRMLDQNQDGKVSKEEREQSRSMMKDKHKKCMKHKEKKDG
jgi:Ca2+-binding EF-hand superfamily protein